MQLELWIFLSLSTVGSALRNKCFSCATTNMKENFIGKQRGPPNRMSNVITFDNKCESDTWIIKDRSTDECDGPCYKWTQALNNSGTYSTMTFRGCYPKLYNTMDPATFKPPNHTFCTTSDIPLQCLSEANIIEHQCWCDGDYCNSSNSFHYNLILLLIFLVYLI